MSENKQRPDRADDPRTADVDTPTQQGKGPQAGGGSTPASAAQSTTAFPATGPAAETQRLSPPDDNGNYRDEDFAPTEVPAATTVAQTAYVGDPVVTPAPVPSQELTAEESAAAQHVDRTRRGTIDFGIFLLRLALSAWLILESVGTFFNLGGGQGIAGLENEFAAYPAGAVLAVAVPVTQLAAGLFLIFGLVTPLFAAVATVVTGFSALHFVATSGEGLNVFAWPDSAWLAVMLLAMSVVLQFTGPGLYSLDFGRRWARRPLWSSWIFVVLAIAAVAALWWFGTGINPFA